MAPAAFPNQTERPHMKNLLIIVPFKDYHLEDIKAACGEGWNIMRYPDGLDGEELAAALDQADVVLGEPDPQILLEHGQRVQLVQMTWAGTDKYTRSSIPFPADTKLCCAVGGFGHIISQYVVAQTLSIMQNLPGYRAQQLQEIWKDRGPIDSLENAKVLIFGAGDIGGFIAKRMSGFDVHAIGVCRDTSTPRPYFDELVTLDEAEKYLGEVDVVVGCIPNSDATAHWMDARRLAMMKEGAVLVNVGRGNFIDNMALAECLAAGHLRGAAIDVTDPEPLPVGHPLWKEPRCIITPHTSGGSFGRHKNTEDRICAICCDNIRRLQAGEALLNPVIG